MLRKSHAELVEKYSFVDKVELTWIKFIIHYTYKDKKKTKVLPRRVSTRRLLATTKNIEKELELSKYGKGKNQDVFII